MGPLSARVEVSAFWIALSLRARGAAWLCRSTRTQGHPPHALCHAFITHTLDAGVALREVQDAVGHADPRTTRRYDRVRGSLDRHPGYALASYLAE